MTVSSMAEIRDAEEARPIRSVSFVVYTIRLAEPGGVTVPGDPGRDLGGAREEPQAALDTGFDGRPHLPGTSLAGALRELVSRQRPDAVDSWLGPVLEDGVDPRASKIWVYGGALTEAAEPEERSSTRIDRRRGAAAANTLRTEQVLPAGTRFEAVLRWDDADPGEVAELASLIAAWRPLIGRGISRGRGRCAVEAARYGTLRLSDPDDLLKWLTLSGPSLARTVALTESAIPPGTAEDSGADPDVLLRGTVSITGSFHIGTGEKPSPGSREPLRLLRTGRDRQPVVPGTSLKGVLRSRAEYILRSVGFSPEPCGGVPCGGCWTCQVFGYGGGTDSSASSVGARSAIRVADAVIVSPVCTERTHIAIDRFTGGVLNGALYTMEALEGGTFPLTVEMLPDVGERRAAEIRAVLRLVVEDLNDGIIGLGGGTSRGYGSVHVDIGGAVGGLPSLAGAQAVLAEMVRDGERD